MEWLAQIGEFLVGVGQTIMQGFRQIGQFITKAIGGVVDFVKQIPEMIASGFTEVKKFVTSLFSGDAGGAREAVVGTQSAQDFVVGPESMTAQIIEDGVSIPGDITGAAGANAQLGYTPTASIPGSATAAVTPAVKGGFLGGAADTGSKFGTVVDFFSSDAGQIVGKGLTSVAAIMYQKSATKSAQKFAASEARRQEAERRNLLAQEQQRQTDLTGYMHQRENEISFAEQKNQWAGFAGKWTNPTTDVPQPRGFGVA